jgi:hypothetical protein
MMVPCNYSNFEADAIRNHRLLIQSKFIVSTSSGTVSTLLTSQLHVFESSNQGLVTELAVCGGKPVRAKDCGLVISLHSH